MDSVNVTQIVAYVEEDPVLGLVLFSVGNVLATSICPFPLGVVGCVIAGVLYGAVLGAVIYVLTCSTGAWITFVLVRLMRPHLIARLGPYARTWERLDAAITREGVVICMLWRVAPIAPFVLSSVLISMTGLTQFQYVWTTTLGVIPSTIPIVSAAALGRNLLVENKVDKMQIGFNVVSILAGIYVMYRLAMIAQARIDRLRVKYGDLKHLLL